MKGSSIFWKVLVIKAIILLVLASVPITIGAPLNTAIEKNNDNSALPLETRTFSNCVIWVFGKCNTVEGPVLWLLGLYMPIFKKNFYINANGGEGEKISVLVRDDKFAGFYGYENMNIQITKATGILFYGGKSLLIDNPIIFMRCKAEYVTLTY